MVSRENTWAANSGDTERRLAPDLAKVDHLVFGAPDLPAGIDHVEKIIGAHPALGGRHPQFGTHNAIMTLGERVYLEIIAPDPDLPRPEEGVLWDLDTIEKPKLITWAMRTDRIVDLAEAAHEAGLTIGAVKQGSRTTPEGEVLNWRLTDPHKANLDTGAPFLIEWGETFHPSGAAPKGGSLTSLRFEHPRAPMLQRAFAALDLSFDVVAAETPAIIATIDTPDGVAELT